MNHAELSRDLALALGYYPESVQINEGDCGVFRVSNSMGPYWRTFDYRDPRVALPVLEWLMLKGVNVWNPDGIPTRWEWSTPDGDHGTTGTLPEAIARAAIAVAKAKRQRVEANENREALQP